jgi:GGDEF domain-containing protein
LAVTFLFALTDYNDRPIINFASYFYLAVIVAVPITFLFPAVSSVSSLVPVSIWTGIYLILLQMIDRDNTADAENLPVIVLEFVLLVTGVLIIHRLAMQIHHAESIMDALAMNAFPNRAHDIVEEDQRIKIEFTRSRRYNRPISLIIISIEPDANKLTRLIMRNIQHDLSHRFISAQVGQIIDDAIRQTDLMLRDRRGNYILLCPETDLAKANSLAKRIHHTMEGRTELEIYIGVAAFPEDALTFDDLLLKAHERLARLTSDEQHVLAPESLLTSTPHR